MKVTKATLNATLKASPDQVHSSKVRDVTLFGNVYAIWRPGRLTRDLLDASNLTLPDEPATWSFKSTLRPRDGQAPNLEQLVKQTLNEDPAGGVKPIPPGLRDVEPRTILGQPVFVETFPGVEMALLDVATVSAPMAVNRLYWKLVQEESLASRWVTASYQEPGGEAIWRTLAGLDSTGALVALLAPLRLKGA